MNLNNLPRESASVLTRDSSVTLEGRRIGQNLERELQMGRYLGVETTTEITTAPVADTAEHEIRLAVRENSVDGKTYGLYVSPVAMREFGMFIPMDAPASGPEAFDRAIQIYHNGGLI